MTSLTINEADIPVLTDKVALITGGASGIGFAAAELLARKGAEVHILDRHERSTAASTAPGSNPLPSRITFHRCDITKWEELRDTFASVGHVDYVFANAGISETEDFLASTSENAELGLEVALEHLKEPTYPLVDVNLKGVLNTIKLAHYSFKRDGVRGSIVITSSATAYAPEWSLPVYSALKLALIGLVRSLRHKFVLENISINAVVPACTETPLVGPQFLKPIKDAGLPISSARHVGCALVFSAVAEESRRVELYGKEPIENLQKSGSWNGRVILTLGDTYTELEEKLADMRPQWFGEKNVVLTRKQQAATDAREL